MSDTDLLIKTLLHQARLHNKQGAIGLGTLFDNAAQEIKRLQAENAELKKQSQWVSVEDELPEFDDDFLVTGSDIELEVCHFDPDWGWLDDFDITHWMPIPTPPEGE